MERKHYLNRNNKYDIIKTSPNKERVSLFKNKQMQERRNSRNGKQCKKDPEAS